MILCYIPLSNYRDYFNVGRIKVYKDLKDIQFKSNEIGMTYIVVDPKLANNVKMKRFYDDGKIGFGRFTPHFYFPFRKVHEILDDGSVGTGKTMIFDGIEWLTKAQLEKKYVGKLIFMDKYRPIENEIRKQMGWDK